MLSFHIYFQLVLDWVYGYQGSGLKKNLWLLEDKVISSRVVHTSHRLLQLLQWAKLSKVAAKN